jgi:hypothetical protein
MATPEQLASKGVLVALEIPLDGAGHPWRTFLVTRHLYQWLQESLPSLEGDRGDLNPTEQLYVRLADYVAGERLDLSRRLHVLQPAKDGIWVLKTTDLRLFGWFASRNVFIGACAGLKHEITRHALTGQYRDLAARQRHEMALDEPKCVYGVDYDDILSDSP